MLWLEACSLACWACWVGTGCASSLLILRTKQHLLDRMSFRNGRCFHLGWHLPQPPSSDSWSKCSVGYTGRLCSLTLMVSLWSFLIFRLTWVICRKCLSDSKKPVWSWNSQVCSIAAESYKDCKQCQSIERGT